MKNFYFLLIAVLLIFFVLPQKTSAQKNGFEGTAVCGMCHKSEKQGQQLPIWMNSKHSQAYKALQTPKADEIAQAKTGKKAVDSPECLKCHASGYDADKALLGAKFKVEDGVQCETCHGAGSAYKNMSVMKAKDEAVKKGLVIPDDIAKFCTTCHNSSSPTFTEFKFEEMWAKIKHNVPKS